MRPEPAPPLSVPELAADELDDYLERTPNARVLDVREPHETLMGPPPRALHVPASELEARLHELDSATPYVVACRVGAKSRWAAQRLHDAGFRRLLHLRDGLLSYSARHAEFELF